MIKMPAAETTTKIIEELSSSSVIHEIINNKDLQENINETLLSHKILPGTLEEILTNLEALEQYSALEQGVIVNAIYIATKSENLNPEFFWNQKQIGAINKYKKNHKEEEVKLPYTFGNYVVQSSEHDYITSLKFKEVGKLWNKILFYNTDLQRKPKEKTDKKGNTTTTPKVISKSVKEITNLMERGMFRSNTITFCVIMDDKSDISYDAGELTLISGDMYIIDGFHRLSAILNRLEQDPDLEDSIDVAIKYLSFDDARFYLGQINKMSKFDKSFVNYLMNDTLEDKIAIEIERKSVLRGRIAKEATVSSKRSYLTSFNVLSKGIRDIFDPQNNADRINIASVLVYFFDYVVDSYKDEFSSNLETLIKARKSSLRNYHNTFVVYLVIAKALYDKYGKDIPADEIIRLVESFDYSFDGEYSKVLFAEGKGKVNSNQVKRNLKKYAEEKIAGLL
ncbi:hypothetical protein EBB07_28895 [Paenibacillaceae bacterium]|nr:hypothetical protein EBB07_28895 [Paenibacillaceae bacterium]